MPAGGPPPPSPLPPLAEGADWLMLREREREREGGRGERDAVAALNCARCVRRASECVWMATDWRVSGVGRVSDRVGLRSAVTVERGWVRQVHDHRTTPIAPLSPALIPLHHQRSLPLGPTKMKEQKKSCPSASGPVDAEIAKERPNGDPRSLQFASRLGLLQGIAATQQCASAPTAPLSNCQDHAGKAAWHMRRTGPWASCFSAR